MAMILVVEDERILGKTLVSSLQADGHDALLARSAERALEIIESQIIDVALVDYRLPGMNGVQLLKSLQSTQPEIGTVMMTAHGEVSTAVEAMKAGAVDFLIKPIDLDVVSMVADRTIKNRRQSDILKHQHRNGRDEFRLDEILGSCPQLERAKDVVRRIARLTIESGSKPPNVLITGETGTGKDLFARALHFERDDGQGPFVQINCAALPANLAESELFGHVKGAFTNAHDTKRGLFEAADEGSLFLDEVNSLDLSIQAKLLTALESCRIRPVGSVDERSVNVRVVAAMNRDPEEEIAEGRLRSDLYHRLRVVQIHLPPLRARGDDLLTLAEHFVRMHCQKFQIPHRRLPEAFKQKLGNYDWPGNVRELKHCLETVVLLSEGELSPLYIPQRQDREFGGTPSLSAFKHYDFSGGPVNLEEIERGWIVSAWESSGHNMTRAASLLGITRDTMRYRAEKYQLGKSGDRVAAGGAVV
jgi:DNA-binding NtrC family response regulator